VAAAAATADEPGSAPATGAVAAGAGAGAAAAAGAGAGPASPWAEGAEGTGEGAHEDLEAAGPVDPNAPNVGVAATFLPGIDAAAILALVAAALAAGVYLLVNPLVQAHDAARTWSDFKNNVARAKQDPFGVQRDWVNYQSWGFIILGLVAVLLALLVLGLWTAQKNKLRSRAFAQAALVVGLAVVLYGILLKTGAVGSTIPSMKEISNGLSSQTQ
jgi:NADH:ubiquinone oxidoreductase subunit 3 (subunit A)